MSQHGLVHVVDDDPGTCAHTAGVLAGGGFETAASTSASCESLLSVQRPDILFLTIRADRADECDALARRVLTTYQDLPVVIVGAADCPERVVPLLDAGAAEYLTLPLVADELLPCVARRALARVPAAGFSRRRTELDLESLRRDQQAGFRVQQALMPVSPLAIGVLQFAYRLAPSLILSGDFVDYFQLPDGRYLFTMADVSGHGASSAFVTVLLKGLTARLQREASPGDDAASMLGWLNRELLAAELHHHSTCFLGLIDAGVQTLSYANAGHFPAAILSERRSDRLHEGLHDGPDAGPLAWTLPARGLPLGRDARARYEAHEARLTAPFALTLFSDGVFEIMTETTIDAREAQLVEMARLAGGDIPDLATRLRLEQVKNMPDDIAILTVAGAA